MTRRGRLLVAAVAGTLLLAAFGEMYAMRERLLPWIARHLDVGGPPIRADYAVLLAGDLQTRPFALASLYHHKYVRKLLITQMPPSDDRRHVEPEAHELTRRVLVALGVDEDDIQLLEMPVMSTYDEALACAALIGANPDAQFVLVTSDYHTRRTLWIFRRLMPDAADRLHMFSAPTDGFTADDWWRSSEGFSTYVREYCRLAFYHLRYGRGIRVVAALAFAMVAVLLVFRYRRRQTVRAS